MESLSSCSNCPSPCGKYILVVVATVLILVAIVLILVAIVLILVTIVLEAFEEKTKQKNPKFEV